VNSRQQINSQPEVTLLANSYNEIGQLKTKTVGADQQGNNPVNTTDYRYNERGWMTSSTSPHFSQQLSYQDPVKGAAAQWNGNISEQIWGPTTTLNQHFVYSYDKLNRLTNGSSPTSGMSEILNYDDMGNITQLTRDGSGISYSYTGNRLHTVSGLIHGSYSYDENGNAKTDRMGMNLSYNHLNLPQQVTGAGNTITYLYDAGGNKLRKTANTTGQRDYAGGIEYQNGVIELIHTAEGIAYRNANGTYSYRYNLTDHLGNVRATIYRNPSTNAVEVLQRDDYYPFGLQKSPNPVYGNNKYLYNGKEKQEELGGQLDYGARFYDPVIGRWNTVDPLAEQYRRWSPYNYTMNNPIRFIDPDGMSVSPIYDIDGTFLGTDENGLQGEAIVMRKENFRQGMSEEEALSYSTNIEDENNKFRGFASKEAMLKYANHYLTLPNRPDYDGVLTLEEANDWYRNGKGEPLYVNAAKIDLSPIKVEDFKDRDSFTPNFFLTTNLQITGRVYGSIKLTIINKDNGQVKLGNNQGLLDIYDFDIRKRDGSIKTDVRNLGTKIGGMVAGEGQSYNIYNYGLGKVNK
ncbi:RHS repeat domain-containing protein, partial [Sphingobacterium spiritivorum]